MPTVQEQQLVAGAGAAATSSRQHGSDAKATARLRGDLKREKALAAELQLKLRAAEEQVITLLLEKTPLCTRDIAALQPHPAEFIR